MLLVADDCKELFELDPSAVLWDGCTGFVDKRISKANSNSLRNASHGVIFGPKFKCLELRICYY